MKTRQMCAVRIHFQLCTDPELLMGEEATAKPHPGEDCMVFDGGIDGVIVAAPTKERLREVLEQWYGDPATMGEGCLDSIMECAMEITIPAVAS